MQRIAVSVGGADAQSWHRLFKSHDWTWQEYIDIKRNNGEEVGDISQYDEDLRPSAEGML